MAKAADAIDSKSIDSFIRVQIPVPVLFCRISRKEYAAGLDPVSIFGSNPKSGISLTVKNRKETKVMNTTMKMNRRISCQSRSIRCSWSSLINYVKIHMKTKTSDTSEEVSYRKYQTIFRYVNCV